MAEPRREKADEFHQHHRALSLVTTIGKMELLVSMALSCAACSAWMAVLEGSLPSQILPEHGSATFTSATFISAAVLAAEFLVRIAVFPGNITRKDSWKQSMINVFTTACSYEVAFRWHGAMCVDNRKSSFGRPGSLEGIIIITLCSAQRPRFSLKRTTLLKWIHRRESRKER